MYGYGYLNPEFCPLYTRGMLLALVLVFSSTVSMVVDWPVPAAMANESSATVGAPVNAPVDAPVVVPSTQSMAADAFRSDGEIEATVELRWASEMPRRWAGTIHWLAKPHHDSQGQQAAPSDAAPTASSTPGFAATAPRITHPQLLSPSVLLCAGVFPTAQGGLSFGPPPRFLMVPAGEGKLASVLSRSGGLTFRMRGDLDDQAVLKIEGEDVASDYSLHFSLRQIMAGNSLNARVNDQSSVAIRRVVASDLRVQLGNEQTIFWTDQKVDVTLVSPMSIPLPPNPGDLTLECLTYRAEDDSLVKQDKWSVAIVGGVLKVNDASWQAPARDGAYRIRMRLRGQTGRGWASAVLTPTTLAGSFTRSITTALPESLTTPLKLPSTAHLVPFASNKAESAIPSSSASSLMPPLPAIPWPSSGDAPTFAESTFSIAVVASTRNLLASQSPPHQVTVGGEPSAVEKVAQEARWQSLGPATPNRGTSTVSRLFLQPTTQWIATASGHESPLKTATYAGQRLTVIASGNQMEFLVPIGQIGQRHRLQIRFPRHTPIRLAAELLDVPAGNLVPQPLGPAYAIVRPGEKLPDRLDPSTNDPSKNRQSSSSSVAGSDVELWYDAAIDFWPRSPTTRLVLSNRSAICDVSFDHIEILADGSPIPPTGQIDLTAQRQVASSAAMRLATVRLEIEDLFSQFGDRAAPTPDRPLDYQQVWVAANRLIEMLHREGYSGAVLTVSSDGVALFPDPSQVAAASWNANWATAAGPVDPLRLLLRLFERESLQLIPCIRPSSPVLELESQLIQNPLSSASIGARLPFGGQMGVWAFDGPTLTAFGIYNPANREVIEHLGRSLVELNRRCGDRACVPMLGILADERSYLRPQPIPLIDEQTLSDFHATLGDSGPPRETLSNWVQKAGAPLFDRWQFERLSVGFQNTLDQIQGRKLLVMSLDSALPSSLVELGRDQRIITTRLNRRALTEPLAMRIRDEACNASVPVPIISGQTPLSYFAAAFHQPISDASGFESGRGGSETIEPTELPLPSLSPESKHGVTPLLEPTESSLALAHLLNRSDRTLLTIGGGGIEQAGSEIRRHSLRAFASLPPVLMNDVASSNAGMSAVRVRYATHGGNGYAYAVNQSRWPVAWEAVLSRPTTVYRLGSHKPNATQTASATAKPIAASVTSVSETPASRNQFSTETRWRTVIGAGELIAIKIKEADATIIDWHASFAGTPHQIAAIRDSVDGAVAAIAALQQVRNRTLITNASFEQEENAGAVPGWLVAQFPANCVAIDNQVAFDGKQSIRLNGQPGRAGGSWIVSQTIAPPRSGRLAMSVRLRGTRPAQETSAEPLVVRMAIEGTVGGTPIRKTKSVNVPADGKWTEPQWLEITKLPNLPMESLRLTIDLMSPGTIWVDDVSCFDHFMTEAEKTHWEHLVYLAAGGLSRGDCIGASRLLDSHWALDLVNPTVPPSGSSALPAEIRPVAFNPSVSPDQTGERSREPRPNPPASANSVETRRGWGERLKSWIPSPLRFGS